LYPIITARIDTKNTDKTRLIFSLTNRSVVHIIASC